MEDYYAPRELKNNPEYIKWMIRVYGIKDGVPYNRHITPHPCTDEDYNAFYPVEAASAGYLAELRSDPKRGFMCLDWDLADPFMVYGTENQDNH